MRQPDVTTGNQLASALSMLGVNFILGGGGGEISFHNQPVRLIAALAQSDEARLRLSLISLFVGIPILTKKTGLPETIAQAAQIFGQPA